LRGRALTRRPSPASAHAPAPRYSTTPWVDHGAHRRIAHADGPANQVGRAAWLRTHYDAPLRIAELARHAGVSASSMHKHCKAATALTPLRYQKRLRLHEARRSMPLERPDAGTAGFRVGDAARRS